MCGGTPCIICGGGGNAWCQGAAPARGRRRTCLVYLFVLIVKDN